MVAPVVIVQDLTKGPYQSGVTPAAGTGFLDSGVAVGTNQALAMLLNDKAGSLTPVLGPEFDGRSFSFTWMEIQNFSDEAYPGLFLRVVPRSVVVALGVPDSAERTFSIQQNFNEQAVPVESFGYNSVVATGAAIIWRGILGDNLNVIGSRRTLEPEPQITIGPKDALLLSTTTPVAVQRNAIVSFRGYYQEQPS